MSAPGILDFGVDSLHSRSSMVRSRLPAAKSTSTTASSNEATRLHEQYYYSSSYESGFVLLQYYSGSRCNGSMTVNYGYRNGACVSDGVSGSTRIYFENNDCATTTAIDFTDENCQVPADSYLLGSLALCQTNSSRANSFAWSFNLHCFPGPSLPVTTDSVLYTYRAGYSNNQSNAEVCGEEILAFQSVATGLCLSTPVEHASYNLSCSSSSSNQFTLNNFLNDDSCSSPAVVNTYEATCPANSLSSSRSQVQQQQQLVLEEVHHPFLNYDSAAAVVMQWQLTTEHNHHEKNVQSAANVWWIIAGTYTKSNTNSATTVRSLNLYTSWFLLILSCVRMPLFSI